MNEKIWSHYIAQAGLDFFGPISPSPQPSRSETTDISHPSLLLSSNWIAETTLPRTVNSLYLCAVPSSDAPH